MEVETLIIGSGVAAAAIAQRILEASPKASIVMLEAGRRVKTKDFGLWENYLVTGRLPYENCRDLDYPARDTEGENASVGATALPLLGARLFAYGGSTMHWGGWAFRLKPEDFELRSRTGQGGDWPIKYDDLEPYYGQAEDYLAISGDSADTTTPRTTDYPFAAFPLSLQDEPLAKAFQSLGIGFGKLPIARRGVSAVLSRHAPCHTTGTCKYCPFGARYVAANYLDDIREWNDYANFEIRLGCVVERINTAEQSRAVSVDFTDGVTGRVETIGAQRIIVAAGTLESAKLLLRSTNADWPTGIGNGGDMVGRNLVTHPYLIFTGDGLKNPKQLQPELNFPTLVSRHFDSPAEQKAGKFMIVNPPDTVPTNLAGLMQAGFSRDEIDRYLVAASKVQVHSMIEVFGQPANCVTNLIGTNRFGLPLTSINYSADPGFKARAAQVKAQMQAIYTAMGATLTADPSISWRADHAASTCRMSDDPADGVVDADLKVHGMDNVFVCSNAVFPATGSVNPTLTLAALALRLGDHLNGLGG